jgi:aspartyl-tRNA(Asn)/glutamyl-tRNA(Gln) amidotransferase subunit C
LAKLELSEAEREKLAKDMGNILDMVEKLKELDTADIEPLVYISEVENQLREDEITGQVSNEASLLNAPASNKPFFKVPKVI